jgi:mannose-6-phosphate isomerase-like protein (cupin superfamily)
MIEKIHHGERLLAIIIPATFNEPGIHFCTQDDASQQIAFMRHPKGKEIVPHVHNPVDRHITDTQEVLIIRKGSLRVDFYTQEKEYLESRTLNEGDVILLIAGGHGFQAMADLEMIEVKQGPYVGEVDKVRFERPVELAG